MKRPFLFKSSLIIAAMMALSACLGTGQQFTSLNAITPTPTGEAPAQPGALPPANGRVLGKGPVRVAMLLPLTAQGFGALAGENFSNATDLALREFDENQVNIVIKDTRGTPEGAAAAAQEALNEGAELILGPLFSRSVPAVANVVKPRGVPIITFSNSSNVASRGTYVFGFTPEPGIVRAIRHAGNQGKRAFAALLPNNALGTLAEAAFREGVTSVGGRVVSIARYNYTNGEPQTRAQEVGALVASGQVDAVFVPDAGDVAPQLVAAVRQAAPNSADLKFVGSGQWDDPRIFRNPSLAGAVYPAPDRSGFEKFAQRYNSAFGKPPIRLASLAYDATSLMIVLTKNFGDQRFSQSRLTNGNGYKGLVDGTFRLTANGAVQRSLAIYQVTSSGPRIVAPAAGSFAQSALN